MDRHSRIFVAGAQTLIGVALIRRLQADGYTSLVGLPPGDPDLTRREDVEKFFQTASPEYVFVASGASGGIAYNQTHPASLISHNLKTTLNLIEVSHAYAVAKLLYLASSCCYPRSCPQPMKVESLGTGPLEPTNQAYATAKLAGLELCRAYAQQHGSAFLCGIPANAFGVDDTFDPQKSHVIAALIARIHAAKINQESQVVVWGTGTPLREFLFADDVADACLFVMKHHVPTDQPINLGGGTVFSIREIAERICRVVGYRGDLIFDSSQPDGMPQKALDSTPLLEMGWRPRVRFDEALEQSYQAYLQLEEERREHHARAVV